MNNEAILLRLQDVIRVEAKDTSDANFLATHKPFTHLQYVPTNMERAEMPYIHEDAFFTQVASHRDRHQFIIVQGDNGSGKSHLIRWMKEKYQNNVSTDEEAILFISRAQSTLRGALEQIIASNVFQNQETSEKLKKIVQANEHLSKEDLKYNILHQFAIAVQKDEDDVQKSINITDRERSQLYAFLVGNETQKLLMGTNGPIERIQKKLASEAKNEVMNELSPFLTADDFKVTYRDAMRIKQSDADRKALRFIESIAEASSSEPPPEVKAKRESIANYLNQFLDQVIQNCTQLRGTDLRDVFFQLRQELKKQGKGLTLFIEDITSFTGIDKALVDVLANTHEGDTFDSSLCRMISLVGVTNAYYDTHFPSNFKNRVSGQLFVDSAAFGNIDGVCDLAARYLNAVYNEAEVLEDWVSQGASATNLPISPMFREHVWSSISVDSHTMTLFPLNKRSIEVLYDSLDEKTPRRFLQRVILKYVQRFFQEGADAFPPDFTELSKTMKVPNWEDVSHDIELKRQASEGELYRYTTLFRVWGNRSITSTTENGKRYIGGLDEDVFRTFELPLIEGIPGAYEEIDNYQLSRIDFSPEKKSENASISKTGDEMQKPPQPQLKQTTEPKPVPVKEDPRVRKYRELETEIENWSVGQPLVSFKTLLEDLLNFIRDVIDWENEGIPASFVQSYLTPRYVEIEGQTSKVQGADPLIFRRTEKFPLALLALAAWRELGNKSWEFADSHHYMLPLLSWFESEKERIIAHVGNLKGVIDRTHLSDWLVAAEFWSTVFAGGFQGTEINTETIYLALMKDKKEITFDRSRGQGWQSIQRKAEVNHHVIDSHNDHFLRFFNQTQGDIIKTGTKTDVFFIDAYRVLQAIERNQKRQWLYDQESLPLRSKTDSVWFRSTNLLHDYKDVIIPVISSEQEENAKIAKKVEELVGEDEIEDLFIELPVFLSYLIQLKEPYDHKKFAFMEDSTFKPSEIKKYIQVVRELDNVIDLGKLAVLLSSNPSAPLRPYIDLLVAWDELLNQTYAKYKQKKKLIEDKWANVNLDSIRDDVRREVNRLKNTALLVIQEVSHAAPKM